jgi:hypothetical protein
MREKDEAMDGAALDRQCCFVAQAALSPALLLFVEAVSQRGFCPGGFAQFRYAAELH